MEQRSLECALVRGGTSKGVFVTAAQLPDRDEAILSLFGSPDERQIDGLGGATSTTSKLMVVADSSEDDVDAEFTFGQVSVDKPVIDYGGTCGNLTFAIGPYAIDEGLIAVEDDRAEVDVRLYNTNTDSVVEQRIPVHDGRTEVVGDFKVYGVPRTGARIDTRFLDPAGSETGELLPFGEPTTELETDDGIYEVSAVDVVNPVVFVRARDVGLSGTELPSGVDKNAELLERLERIRGAAAERLGFVDDAAESAEKSPGIPKLAFVAEPTTYTTLTGDTVSGGDIDITARIMSMQKLHPVYAVSGASCTASAALIPGTIPNEVVATNGDTVTLGHPKGTMSVTVSLDSGRLDVEAVEISRTQRRLMEGTAYYLMDD